MENRNVIAAYSGGALPAAIGIIRMSGQGAFEILDKIFMPKGKNMITDSNNRKMIYGELLACDGKTLDICLACRFKGPNSYTGEDMAEIYCHGSEAIVAAALRAAFQAGARQAEAGEFTKRAYLNGRMGLSDAEAVADLIYSRTEAGAKNAAALLKGGSYRRLGEMREDILAMISHFYAVCDYSDEDIEPFEYISAVQKLDGICAQLDKIYKGYLRSHLLTDGIPVAVVGRPNVGKSSVFNALAGFDRAIVTAEAGTTRDVVGHRITLGGHQLELMDTAGIRQGLSAAEVMGIERSRRAVDEAALVLAVFDGSEHLTDEDIETIELCKDKKTLAVINKSDLPQVIGGRVEEAFDSVLSVSAAEGSGIEDIAAWLENQAALMTPTEALITGQRQGELIRSALEALRQARDSAGMGMTADAFLLDAEKGARFLGQILGFEVDIDITEGIFSRFCVGK